jgi:Protein of Unknown function (DUF2784)
VAHQLLAEVVMLLHFGFLVFVALGGFLAWRWPWLFVPHVAAVTWGALSVAAGLLCPLTGWEDWARRRAGEQGLPRGFIDTYITGVVYPAEYLVTAQVLVATLVAVSWAGLLVRARRRRRSGLTLPSAGRSRVPPGDAGPPAGGRCD